MNFVKNSFDEGFDFAIFSAGKDTALKFAPIAAPKNVRSLITVVLSEWIFLYL